MCASLEMRFKKWDHKVKHMKIDIGEKPDECEKAFSQPHLLNEHKKIHMLEVRFIVDRNVKI
jgi:hypothetical protein